MTGAAKTEAWAAPPNGGSPGTPFRRQAGPGTTSWNGTGSFSRRHDRVRDGLLHQQLASSSVTFALQTHDQRSERNKSASQVLPHHAIDLAGSSQPGRRLDLKSSYRVGAF